VLDDPDHAFDLTSAELTRALLSADGAGVRDVARRRLGERVARGAKRGFGIPVQRWVAGKWCERVAESLRGGLLDGEGWISGAAAAAQLDRAAQAGWSPNQLWYLFVLESWLRRERNETVPTAMHSDEKVLSAITCS
jgi:hypothetical protein